MFPQAVPKRSTQRTTHRRNYALTLSPCRLRGRRLGDGGEEKEHQQGGSKRRSTAPTNISASLCGLLLAPWERVESWVTLRLDFIESARVDNAHGADAK